MMRSTLLRVLPLLCAGVLAAPAAAQAQSAADLAPGTRVRIMDPAAGQVVGSVAEVRGDSLFVLASTGDEVRTSAVSLQSIYSLQVSRGRSRPASALRGAGVGLVGGAVGGAGAGVLIDLVAGHCDRMKEEVCINTGTAAIVGAILGGVAGTGVGAVVGFVYPRERWSAVPVRNAPVLTVSPDRDGMRVGLSFNFR